MTDIDEDERPVCPICGDETYGRPCDTSYCAGHRAGYQRGHEAGHEDAGLAAIARASAAYEAGYAACRETMTPAVLATEDAYLLGHEAGRLAAIRAEVERLLWQLENTASDAQQTAAREFRWRSGDSPFGLRSSQEMVARDYALARRFVDQAADCRRWLEATR